MAYNLNLDMSNMFGRKRDEEETSNIVAGAGAGGTLLGELPGGASIPPIETQPMSDPDYQSGTELDPDAPPAAAPGALPANWMASESAKNFPSAESDPPLGVGDIVGTAPTSSTLPPLGSGPPDNPMAPGAGGVFGGTDDLPQSYPEDSPWNTVPADESLYYTDEFIDPQIKEGILQRDPVQLTADQMAAAGVTGVDPMTAAGVAGVAGPTAAQLTPQDQMARAGQEAQLQLLKSIAGGQMSPVIEQQRERGLQTALATAASMRGAPTSAVQRTLGQQMSEVNRQAYEAAAQQQLQATQMLGQAATQMRGQEIDLAGQQAQLEQQAGILGTQLEQQRAMQEAEFEQTARLTNQQLAQERNNLMGQFQQQSNMTNAQMANEMMRAESQVNAQLEQQRDAMVSSLTGMGVDRNVALLQVNNELARLREELLYQFWAGKLGATTEVTKAILEETAFTEDMWEQLIEEGAILNMFGEYATPPGFGVPGMKVGGDEVGHNWPNEPLTGETTWSGEPQNVPGTTGGWVWNSETGQWERGGGDVGVPSGIEAKENVDLIGRKNELFRTREAQPFGQMTHGSEFDTLLGGRAFDPDPMSSQLMGTRKLSQAQPGLIPAYTGANRVATAKDALGRIRSAVDNAPPLGFADRFRQGAKDVSSYIQAGNIGAMGTQMLMGDKEERKAATMGIAKLGAQKALEEGLETAGKWIDKKAAAEIAASKGVQEAAEATAQIAGEAGKETLKSATKEVAEEGATLTAASTAPYIGGALQFIGDVASGDQILPAGITATGSTLGALGGTAAAAALGEAAATGAAMAAIGGGSGAASGSWVPGIGNIIGGLVGAGVGGAAAAPLAAAARQEERIAQYAPAGGLQDFGGKVGAPGLPGTGSREFAGMTSVGQSPGQGSLGIGRRKSQMVPSGLETKKYIEGLTPVSNPLGLVPSDEYSKTGIGPSRDELSDFLRTLNPVKYDYKPEFGGEKNQYGIIAQDAQRTPVGDSFVKQNGDGTHMIDTGKATMVNMAALANQQNILDEQGMMLAELLKRRG